MQLLLLLLLVLPLGLNGAENLTTKLQESARTEAKYKEAIKKLEQEKAANEAAIKINAEERRKILCTVYAEILANRYREAFSDPFYPKVELEDGKKLRLTLLVDIPNVLFPNRNYRDAAFTDTMRHLQDLVATLLAPQSIQLGDYHSPASQGWNYVSPQQQGWGRFHGYILEWEATRNT